MDEIPGKELRLIVGGREIDRGNLGANSIRYPHCFPETFPPTNFHHPPLATAFPEPENTQEPLVLFCIRFVLSLK